MSTGLTLAFSSRKRGPHIGRLIRHLKQSSGLANIEILVQINPGKDSLSQVYNSFLHQASYSILCLIHDDIAFQRQSHWGLQVIKAFQSNPKAAALSPAGSTSLLEHGIYWLPPEDMLGSVQHQLAHKTIDSKYTQTPASVLPALVLDGLFLAVHRERLNASFNENLEGFHFYDIDFSFQQSLAHLKHHGGQCLVLPNLGIIHKSGGQTDAQFESARKIFVRQYSADLPRRLLPELLLQPIYDPAPPLKKNTERVGALILQSQTDLTTIKTSSQRAHLEQDLSTIKHINLKQQIVSQTESQHEIKQWIKQHALEYVLLLDHRVESLQHWLPRLLKRFRQVPKLGTLGVRLHYSDSHLLLHNGMQLYTHQNQYDILYRGIHRPYAYRNGLEFNCLGAPALALMLKAQDFLDWGALGKQTWIPGLELSLNALNAGCINAVDSSLAGYWHDDQVEPEPEEYEAFLNYLHHWMETQGQTAAIQARVQRF